MNVSRLVWLVAVAGCASHAARPTSHAAHATARATTPCQPDRPPLDAEQVFHQLEQYSAYDHAWRDDETPSGTFGTCTIDRGVIRDRAGVEIAELHCGITVKAPGWIDHLGLQVGARGQDVIDRERAHGDLVCVSDGPERSRCWFSGAGDDEQLTEADQYTVDGDVMAAAGAGDASEVTGAPALAFFAPRTIVELTRRVYCH